MVSQYISYFQIKLFLLKNSILSIVSYDQVIISCLYQFLICNFKMQLEEFAFIYQDLKTQLKEIPSLPLLLKSIEKTTKKLDCLNLYSLVDRRQFDFQLFQKQTFDEITHLLKQVADLTLQAQEGSMNMQNLLDLEHRMEGIKQEKMQAFDKLNKIEESLQAEVQSLIDPLVLNHAPNLQNQIKQVQEDEEEIAEEHQYTSSTQQNRLDYLKKQIDEINTKIVRINRGKGKWFDGDHNDFVKLYNRAGGDAKKIVQEGVKVLGMKNIEIMDHLQVYETYLQLEKEKKLAAQQFKNMKFLQQQTKNEINLQNQIQKQQRQRIRKKIKQQQNLQKKVQIQEFKRKKVEQHQKIIQKVQKQREQQKKSIRVSVDKKRQIEDRNKKLILQRQQQFKQRNSSAVGTAISINKPKNILSHNEPNSLKLNKILKAPPLPSSEPKKL